MPKFGYFLTVMAVVCAGSAPWAQQALPPLLEVGDPAPPLDLTFFQGKSFQIDEGLGKNVYLIEFWATWCGPCKTSIPHLDALQKKFAESGLVVVGITDEPAKVVKPYVKKMGKKMNYRIGLDQNRQTYRNYMDAARQSSIPWAFVVDKRGTIVWQGHPMDSILEPLVEALLEEEVEMEPPKIYGPPAVVSESEI